MKSRRPRYTIAEIEFNVILQWLLKIQYVVPWYTCAYRTNCLVDFVFHRNWDVEIVQFWHYHLWCVRDMSHGYLSHDPFAVVHTQRYRTNIQNNNMCCVVLCRRLYSLWNREWNIRKTSEQSVLEKCTYRIMDSIHKRRHMIKSILQNAQQIFTHWQHFGVPYIWV